MTMFRVSAKSKTSSFSIGVPTAVAALAKAEELQISGLSAIVFYDVAGRECAKEKMEALAADEICQTPSSKTLPP